ncbi:uncharacterized protein MYCFIDRAFT_173301 [Pseudocercospora fijiensis CIRAD86]|uniref:Uncharacterized protein n=1 Tax=Pseudocercospora fijiensis (strain CIRAD86) TaxID=383855 RepID=M3B4K6_PSEFD|nr:uncharacterized protein MYCFIDRAFT_173301 [Pseudocercospora fijiensis CIRAD86]EME84277.1 hypothetical protein MYCFIDRAFT_173301 [Pseudocercospora fijiensis CIRAD86]
MWVIEASAVYGQRFTSLNFTFVKSRFDAPDGLRPSVIGARIELAALFMFSPQRQAPQTPSPAPATSKSEIL